MFKTENYLHNLKSEILLNISIQTLTGLNDSVRSLNLNSLDP